MSLVVSPLRDTFLLAWAGNAPKRTPARFTEYGRIRAYFCVCFGLKGFTLNHFHPHSNARFCKSRSCILFLMLKAQLVSLLLSGGGRLLRCPLRARRALAVGCCKCGSGVIRFACFLCLVSVVAGVALALVCVRDTFRLWSKSVRAKLQTLVSSPQQRANKALHPTAYSLRFGRSSRRFGFRRRVSLVVRPVRAAWQEIVN